MKTHALNGLNVPIDNGKERTRQSWQKWGESRLTASERKAGWVALVGLFTSEHGTYYRVNYAAQSLQLHVKLNGEIVR